MERNGRFTFAAAVCIVALSLSPLSRARIIYVDDDARGGQNGSTWTQAYADLQAALDAAHSGDEVRVAAGTYRPSKGELAWARRRWATFALIKGVAVRGGYAGLAGPEPNACDPVRFESILSGDLEADDVGGTNEDDNSFHVVKGDNTDATAILEGFTITGGTAEGWNGTDLSGGGLNIRQGNPTIIRCTFRRNRADWGGAVWIYEGGGTFVDCTFVDNSAEYTGGAVESESSHPTLIGCTFLRNFADRMGSGGGALNIDKQSKIDLTSCRFVANVGLPGGAIRNNGGSATITNCLFVGNRTYMRTDSLAPVALGVDVPTEAASRSGGDRDWLGGMAGAIYNTAGGTLILTSCTVANNSSDWYSGVYNGSGCPCTVVNCILWANNDRNGATRSSQIQGSDVLAYYCCVQGSAAGLAGLFNIDVNPVFTQPGRWAAADNPSQSAHPADLTAQWIDGDYHLKSQAGRWDPNDKIWVADDVTSPCIDAGDPNSPVGDEPEPNGGRVNMGAYGGMAEASKSSFKKP